MEREIQIAGHWLVFVLILGMVLSMCGVTATAIGYTYADPSQAAAHTVLHPLARVSIILGPIALMVGAAMLLGSAYGMRSHKGTKSLPMAPKGYRALKHSAYNALDEDEEDEAPGPIAAWRGADAMRQEDHGLSSNA